MSIEARYGGGSDGKCPALVVGSRERIVLFWFISGVAKCTNLKLKYGNLADFSWLCARGRVRC
jgi:hypothetical protein